MIAFFKGKGVGLLAGIQIENKTHQQTILACAKLFEAKMASFVKAYRDQQIKKLRQRTPDKPAKKIIA